MSVSVKLFSNISSKNNNLMLFLFWIFFGFQTVNVSNHFDNWLIVLPANSEALDTEFTFTWSKSKFSIFGFWTLGFRKLWWPNNQLIDKIISRLIKGCNYQLCRFNKTFIFSNKRIVLSIIFLFPQDDVIKLLVLFDQKTDKTEESSKLSHLSRFN